MQDIEQEARKVIVDAATMYGATCRFQRTDGPEMRVVVAKGPREVAMYFRRYADGATAAHLQGVLGDLHRALIKVGAIPEDAPPLRMPDFVAQVHRAPVRHLGPIGEMLRAAPSNRTSLLA